MTRLTYPTLSGLMASGFLVLSIYAGSRGFAHFDPALIWYAVACVVCAFAIAWRLTAWLQRPPTWRLFRSGLATLWRGDSAVEKTRHLFAKVQELYAAQHFIRKRRFSRWVAHMCISWGTMLAFALTFPLVFGWVHFESLASDPKVYDVLVFGFKVDRFHVQSLKAILMFNLLNLASVLLLIGVIMAGWRRWQDAGERATQTFSEDILPLIILFAVGATGLMLTVNARLMAGTGFATFAIIHMVCVIVLLLYLPFGKLLHVWQRSGHLMVSFFKKAHASDMACCRRCKREYAMKQQISDLKEVLENLGFNYRFVADNGLAVHYQDICPPCRRSLLALNQGASLGR